MGGLFCRCSRPEWDNEIMVDSIVLARLSAWESIDFNILLGV